MGNVYDYKGNVVLSEFMPAYYDENVKGIGHRGFPSIAPENTLPSYILAKKRGFRYVETDVAITSDGVLVLLHDTTIDRTSNGSGSIKNMTLSQARQYDFGSWKSSEYEGTKIPTFEEFLDLCRALILYPHLHLHSDLNLSQQQLENMIDQVNKRGLRGKASYIEYSLPLLQSIKEYDPYARLGFPSNTPSINDIEKCLSLRTQYNEVFYDPPYTMMTDELCDAFGENGIPIEVWTIDSEETILSLNSYINGVVSNSLHAGRVLFENALKSN